MDRRSRGGHGVLQGASVRILFLVHRSWPYHGGSERYVLEHALEARRRGHEPVIATTVAWDMDAFVKPGGRRLPPGEFTHEGVRIIRFPVVNPPFQHLLRAVMRRLAPGGPDRFFFPNPFVPSLDRWLAKDAPGKFDLVHANAMPFMIHGGWRYSRKNGVPLVTVPHANLGSPGHRIEPLRYFAGDQREILRSSSLVVAQNRFEKGVYIEECGVDPDMVMVHGSGVDPDEWVGASRERALAALSLPPGLPLVLSMTAHCRDKGSFTLLDSAMDLWARGMDFILVLAGPVLPDFREYLDARSTDIPGGKLAVTGYLPEPVRKDLFAAAQIVAAPSRLDAFGIVVLDGWISGSPVIGCNAGGMPDLIEHGRDGFLIDFDHREALSERLKQLLSDGVLSTNMASRGRNKVLESHTWKMVTGRFFHELERRGLCTG